MQDKALADNKLIVEEENKQEPKFFVRMDQAHNNIGNKNNLDDDEDIPATLQTDPNDEF